MSTLVVAHRGDSEAARENTPEAFARAVEAGVDVVEIDIRTTSGGTSIVLHDPTALRLWGVANWVSDLNLGRPTDGADFTVGSIADRGHGQCRIPTLAETLEQFTELNQGRERPVTLLIDTVSPDDVAVAIEVVRSFRTTHDATLLPIRWCGNTEAMFLVREQLPDADVCYNHEDRHLDLDVVQRLRPSTINVEWSLLSEQLIEQVHALGLACACWTVDDAATMTWLLGKGVDSITTNRPRLLRKLLDGGTSPLALAFFGEQVLSVEAGLGLEAARLVSVAHDLAVWANAYTRTAGLGEVTTKAHDADLVTAVDLAVEQHVREVIAERLGPDHLVVGEEMGGQAEPGRPVWYLDPVDGTTNLANTLPWTSMSLALAIDGVPVVASVAQPAMGNVFLAGRGLGATLNGVPLRLPECPGLSGRTVTTEWDAHAMWPGMDRFLAGLAGQHCTPRIMGSGTLALTGVAAGWAAAGMVHRFNPIDHLAGVLIAHEAGAEVLGTDGGPTLFPGSGGVVVAAPGAGRLVLDALG